MVHLPIAARISPLAYAIVPVNVSAKNRAFAAQSPALGYRFTFQELSYVHTGNKR